MNKAKRKDKTKTYEQILWEGTLLAAKLIEKYDEVVLANIKFKS